MLFDRIPREVDSVYRRQLALAGGFWKKFREAPDFTGKRVLDLGCGYGALIADMVARGAGSCTGLDLSAERVETARRIAQEKGHAGRASFHAGDIREFPEGAFDIIVSKDTFEHIEDLKGVMDALAQRLKSGGRLYLGFGPLYNSPFGDHGWYSSLPWAHVLAGERAVVARINRKSGTHYVDLPDLGLNGLTPAEFRRYLRHEAMEMESLAVNSVDGVAKRLAIQPMNILRHIGPLEPYFTVSIYTVLRRRPNAREVLS